MTKCEALGLEIHPKGESSMTRDDAVDFVKDQHKVIQEYADQTKITLSVKDGKAAAAPGPMLAKIQNVLSLWVVLTRPDSSGEVDLAERRTSWEDQTRKSLAKGKDEGAVAYIKRIGTFYGDTYLGVNQFPEKSFTSTGFVYDDFQNFLDGKVEDVATFHEIVKSTVQHLVGSAYMSRYVTSLEGRMK